MADRIDCLACLAQFAGSEENLFAFPRVDEGQVIKLTRRFAISLLRRCVASAERGINGVRAELGIIAACKQPGRREGGVESFDESQRKSPRLATTSPITHMVLQLR
ncbi:MAG: hypothetical protein ACKO38_12875 [Planctomycetota bacterium]